MLPHLAQIDTKDICTDPEAGIRKDFALPYMLEARHRKLMNFKTRSRSQVENDLVGAPREAHHRTNSHQNLREADELCHARFHAVLDRRCDSVSESFVTLPAPMTTTASPDFAAPSVAGISVGWCA